MKNLKKVLALVLAFACAFTMFAGAAYSDQADIKHPEAVDMLTALGIVNGYTDGSFQGEQVVNRGEMAKMVAMIVSGGNDVKTAYQGAPTNFQDLTADSSTAWSAPYVKYIEGLNIVAGKSATKFAPSDKVTGTEVAKMMLVALGYDPVKAGLQGHGWAQNTLALGNTAGLFDGVTNPINADCNRDDAAQILYNAIKADTVALKDGEYQKKEITSNGLVEYKKDATVYEVTVNASEVDGSSATAAEKQAVKDLNGTQYNSFAEAKMAVESAAGANVAQIVYGTEYTIPSKTIKVSDFTWGSSTKNETLGKKYMKLDESDAFTLEKVEKNDDKNEYSINGGLFTKLDKDYSSLMRQQVKVLYKDGKTDKVYGIYATDDNKVYKTTAGDLSKVSNENAKIKFGGTTYKTDGNINTIDVYDFNNNTAVKLDTLVDNSTKAPYSLTLIDNDNDGKIELGVIEPFTVSKVTYVGTSSVTAGTSYKFDDHHIYDGIKKDDYAKITAAANTVDSKAVLEKADVVSGKVGGTKGSPVSSVQVDGKWYDTAATVSVSVDNSYDFAVVNGYVFAADLTAESTKDVVFISDVDTETNGSFSSNEVTVDAKAYFMDGTNQVIKVAKVDDKKLGKANDGDKAVKWDTALIKDRLYTFTTNSSGEYELKNLNDSSNKAGYDSYSKSTDQFTASNDRIGSTAIADDAVIFVQKNNGGTIADTKVITGKQLKSWNTNFGGVNAQILTSKVNGISYVKVAALSATASVPTSSGDYTYGYVIDDANGGPYVGKNADGDTVVWMTVWNGNEEVVVYQKGSTIPAAKGSAVKYKEESGQEVKEIAVLTTKVALTGVEDKNKGIITFENGTKAYSLEQDEDMPIIGIKSADKKGEVVARGAVAEAQSKNDGKWTLNAYIDADNASLDAANKVVALFYDVDNELDVAGNEIAKVDYTNGNAAVATLKGAMTTSTADGLTVANAWEVSKTGIGTVKTLAAVSADLDAVDVAVEVVSSTSKVTSASYATQTITMTGTEDFVAGDTVLKVMLTKGDFSATRFVKVTVTV